MTLLSEHCQTDSVFMVAKFKVKKTIRTLMTLDLEFCQLVPLLLMTLPLEPCHTGGVCMVAKLK